MSVSEWVGILGGMGISAIAIWRIPRFWRGTTGSVLEQRLRPGWRYGQASYRRYLAALPVLSFAFGALMLGAAIGGPGSHAPVGSLLYNLGYVGFFLVVFGFALAIVGISIILFGRPRSLMPPWLRER